MDPTYSIAVCNLDQAATLRESLTSILRQITREYEVVVVNDGSTDGSLDILEDLSRTHEKLRYVVGDNNNIAEARNQSYREARANTCSPPWTRMTGIKKNLRLRRHLTR